MRVILKENEVRLLEQFAYAELGKEDFLRQYPIDLVNNRAYLVDLIVTTTKERDAENLETLPDVTALLGIYDDFDFQKKYRELIKEDWHRMHENLVDCLDPTIFNEESFIYVLSQIFPYHAHGVEDFMVPIWSKCLWQIYRIKSERGIKVISKYVNSDFQYLRETAKKLLSKLEDG